MVLLFLKFGLEYSVKRFGIYLLLLISLVGCSRENLYVQSDYLTHDDLASTHVGSPDPRKEEPWAGQRLIVGWSVPERFLNEPDVRLVLTLRFRNREQAIKSFPLESSSGKYIYRLMNDEFFEKRGVLTYQAKIMSGEDKVLYTWTHQLWTDLLEIEMTELSTSE
ncbi:MAG: hypothetical protein ACI8RA_000164 [Chlamydiales bacterium]